jgi:hypothetical protein
VDHPAAGAAYTNVSGTLFGPNGPSFLDVQQGNLGDCWLLASLAEVAYRDPQDIRNMFTADGTGVENGVTVSLYNVRFFNTAGVAEYVTVDTELPAGGTLYDQPINGVLWVALAEKAYAEANGQGYVTTNHPGSDSYAALNLGCPSWALQVITGTNQGNPSFNASQIPAAWKAGDFIVLTTSDVAASSYIVGAIVNGVPETHCYALIGSPTTYTASNAAAAASPVANYNASATSSSLPYEVFNPWGTNSSGWAPSTFNGNQVYGLFTANANFLSQNYAGQSFASGTATGAETEGLQIQKRLAAETAADLVLAGWGT